MTTKNRNKKSHVSGRRLASLGSASRAERGIALIVTLFVVALLTILVLEYHFDAVIEIDMAANYAHDVRAHHLALAGVQFAQALLQIDDPTSDGPEDAWYTLGLIPTCTPPQQLLELVAASGASSDSSQPSPPPFASEPSDNRSAQETQSDEGCVSLRVIDESGKLPINALAPPPRTPPQPTRPPQPGGPPTRPPNSGNADRWKKIFVEFFNSFEIESQIVGALKDWIDGDPDEDLDGGAEQPYYDGLATPYKVRDLPMRMLGELRLIRGFDIDTLSKLFPGITPQSIADVDLGSNRYLTAYGGASPKVNFNTADPVVLHALIVGLGGNCEEENILSQRQQKQFRKPNEITALCNAPGLSNVADVKSTAFRIEASGQIGAIRKKAVAVVERSTQGATQGATTMKYFKIE